ncbi:MAG: PPC domain-containing protein, partial [Anaerolineae bacterium]|nr:PPC domain-containing protein [Anaerolineae bacterium]
PGREVAGTFGEADSRQVWYYKSPGNERVTITAIAAEDAFDLDVALRVVAPNGAELTFVADDEEGFLFNPLDAQLRELLLQQPGNYAIIVERQDGTGEYRLGVSAPQTLELAAGTTTRNGAIRESLPAQRYTFSASGGQTLTITLSANSGTLDPLLRLLDANGNVLVENDDAEENDLGTDAQIYQFSIPFSSTYTIEAGRFDGEGEYTLEITVNP